MKTFRIGFSRQVLFHNIGWEARGIRYIHRLSIVLPEVIIHLLPVLGSGWQSQSSHKKPLPSAAQVVVCGGGVHRIICCLSSTKVWRQGCHTAGAGKVYVQLAVVDKCSFSYDLNKPETVVFSVLLDLN